jgi:hypothetical protein
MSCMIGALVRKCQSGVLALAMFLRDSIPGLRIPTLGLVEISQILLIIAIILQF